MKSLAVFPSSREVRLIDRPEPVIAGPAEVKLRILEAGICGTDREITSFQYGTRQWTPPSVNRRSHRGGLRPSVGRVARSETGHGTVNTNSGRE